MWNIIKIFRGRFFKGEMSWTSIDACINDFVEVTNQIMENNLPKTVKTTKRIGILH